MEWIGWIACSSAIYPLAVAWWSNRRTTLVHALSWALAAWLSWTGVFAADEGTADTARYLMLCLTSCAGIAVLGARRPIVGPWNFVLLGLLGVLLLPLAEYALLGTPLLDPLRLAFVVCTLAVGVLNYLPTHLALAVVLAGVACGLELAGLLHESVPRAGPALIGAACWVGWLLMWRPIPAAEFDCEWLAFRDRYGLMWGQRVREQFNQAAQHAAWPVVLRWSGLRRTARDQALSAAEQTAIVETLRAVLKRFGVTEIGSVSDGST